MNQKSKFQLKWCAGQTGKQRPKKVCPSIPTPTDKKIFQTILMIHVSRGTIGKTNVLSPRPRRCVNHSCFTIARVTSQKQSCTKFTHCDRHFPKKQRDFCIQIYIWYPRWLLLIDVDPRLHYCCIAREMHTRLNYACDCETPSLLTMPGLGGC